MDGFATVDFSRPFFLCFQKNSPDSSFFFVFFFFSFFSCCSAPSRAISNTSGSLRKTDRHKRDGKGTKKKENKKTKKCTGSFSFFPYKSTEPSLVFLSFVSLLSFFSTGFLHSLSDCFSWMLNIFFLVCQRYNHKGDMWSLFIYLLCKWVQTYKRTNVHTFSPSPPKKIFVWQRRWTTHNWKWKQSPLLVFVPERKKCWNVWKKKKKKSKKKRKIKNKKKRGGRREKSDNIHTNKDKMLTAIVWVMATYHTSLPFGIGKRILKCLYHFCLLTLSFRFHTTFDLVLSNCPHSVCVQPYHTNHEKKEDRESMYICTNNLPPNTRQRRKGGG